jgi:hypothetical protein
MSLELFTPTVDGNPLYKTVFDVDFSNATDDKSLKKAFDEHYNSFVAFIKDILEPIKSITQVAEVFNYSLLAASLLQNKAEHRYNEILADAPAEYSVETLVRAQLGGSDDEDDEDAELLSPRTKRIYYASELSKQMSSKFSYSGSAMRALVTVAVMANCACRTNKMASASAVLNAFNPSKLVLDSSINNDYSVIGTLTMNHFNTMNQHYSIPVNEMHRYNRDSKNDYSKIFANKLVELLGIEDMPVVDRARIEELRDFYLDTLCRFFFEIRIITFPRVLHLISTICENAEKNGLISEDVLTEACPPECIALLGNEAILTKDSVDMDVTYLRVNGGIKSFAMLTERFNLLASHKQALLNKVISQI